MFHVERAARALVLGAFVFSAAASARVDPAFPSQEGAPPSAGADAGSAQQTPEKTREATAPSKRTRKDAASSTSGAKKSSRSASSATTKTASGKKASSKARTKRDPRTLGLGRSCAKRADCASRAQVCLRQQDQRGKKLARGFCALPCAALEQGLTKTRPGFRARDPVTTKKLLQKPPPARCPARFKCRTKGGDIPIDLCVRD